MKRRVIRQANKAFTITLPIEWVRRNNIEKNPEVDVKAVGNTLEINSANRIIGGKTKIDLSNLDKRLIAIIISSVYARGIDEIEITSDNEISQDIYNALSHLIGFALVNQKENYYLVKDISPGQYQDLDEIFKRTFQIVLIYLESAINDIFGEEKETEESLWIRDKEVNKFCLYLQRAINKQSYSRPENEKIIFTYSYALEVIGDEIGRVWRANIEEKVEKSKEIKKIMEMTYEALRLSYELLSETNYEKIKKIFEIRHQIRRISLNITSKKRGTIIFLRKAVNLIEHISDLRHLSLMKEH